MQIIKLEEGKQIQSLCGNYLYVGPRLVYHHRALKLPPTHTDGTPWQYFEDDDSQKIEPLELEESNESTDVALQNQGTSSRDEDPEVSGRTQERDED